MGWSDPQALASLRAVSGGVGGGWVGGVCTEMAGMKVEGALHLPSH